MPGTQGAWTPKRRGRNPPTSAVASSGSTRGPQVGTRKEGFARTPKRTRSTLEMLRQVLLNPGNGVWARRGARRRRRPRRRAGVSLCDPDPRRVGNRTTAVACAWRLRVGRVAARRPGARRGRGPPVNTRRPPPTLDGRAHTGRPGQPNGTGVVLLISRLVFSWCGWGLGCRCARQGLSLLALTGTPTTQTDHRAQVARHR
jgi:hypothetical protein